MNLSSMFRSPLVETIFDAVLRVSGGPAFTPLVPATKARIKVRAADAGERKREAQARQRRARKITRRMQK